MATRGENRNTLFLTPEVAIQGDVEGQGNQTPEGRGQAMEDLENHEVPQWNTQEPGEGHQETEGLENPGIPQQRTQEGEDEDVWDQVLD